MVHFFGPQSKNNTGMAALRAGLPVITVKAAVNTQSNAIIIIILWPKNVVQINLLITTNTERAGQFQLSVTCSK